MKARPRKNSGQWIKAVFLLAVLSALAWVFYPPVRPVILANKVTLIWGLGLGVLAWLIISALRRLFRKPPPPVRHPVFRRTLPKEQPLRSFDLRTLEPLAKNGEEPPAANAVRRFVLTPYAAPGAVVPSGEKPVAALALVARLRAIDWFQFETVMSILYQKQGYAVTRRGGAGPNGGIDLVIEKNGARKAVQCKQWKSGTVQEKMVQEFAGALQRAEIPAGVLVTLGGGTGPAKALAEEQGVEILEESQLVRMLAAADAEHDPVVLELLNDQRKFCPKCESEMVLRAAPAGPNSRGQLWGCSTWPQCDYTMQLS